MNHSMELISEFSAVKDDKKLRATLRPVREISTTFRRWFISWSTVKGLCLFSSGITIVITEPSTRQEVRLNLRP